MPSHEVPVSIGRAPKPGIVERSPLSFSEKVAQKVTERLRPMSLEHVLSQGVEPNQLYLHIPFCTEICTFCAYHTRRDSGNKKERFVDEFSKHVTDRLGRLSSDAHIRRIDIGGGTPSVLSLEQLAQITERVRDVVDATDATWNIELHPANVSEPYLSGLMDLGFNRFSMGVQNLVQSERHDLGRDLTSVDQDREAMEVLRATGLPYNIDLMYATPGQTAESWQTTLQSLVHDHRPPEITAYQYVNAKGAISRIKVRNGSMGQQSRSLRHQMHRDASAFLRDQGYYRTSTLTFADGQQAQTDYDLIRVRSDFLGIGPRTFSKIGSTAFIDPHTHQDFIDGGLETDTYTYAGRAVPFMRNGVVHSLLASRTEAKVPGAWKEQLKPYMADIVSGTYAGLYYALNTVQAS